MDKDTMAATFEPIPNEKTRELMRRLLAVPNQEAMTEKGLTTNNSAHAECDQSKQRVKQI